MPFKDISYLELWPPFCSTEWNHFSILVEGIKRKNSVMILNLDQRFKRRCPLKIFLIWSSHSLLFSGANHLCNFSRGYYEEQFGPVVQEEMPFNDISYLELWRQFCSVELYHVCNILVACIKRNNSVKLF